MASFLCIVPVPLQSTRFRSLKFRPFPIDLVQRSNCVTINLLKRHRACKETWKENFSSPMQFQETSSRDNTHTHKTWKQQQFPNSESQNIRPKSQARSKRDAACKARDLKGTSPIIIWRQFRETHPGRTQQTHTHTHTKVGKQQYNFFSLPRAKHPTDLLIDRYSPLLAPDSRTSLSVSGGLFVLFVCRASDRKQKTNYPRNWIGSKANKKTQNKTSKFR